MLFILIRPLRPLHGELGDQPRATRPSAWLHDRLLTDRGLGRAGHRASRAPDLAEDFTPRRDFDAGITAPPLRVAMRVIGNGFTEIAPAWRRRCCSRASTWWAPLARRGAWLSTHVLLRESALWKDWHAEGVVEQQREADYTYRLAVDAPAAKEVRLFGLADWVVERFAARRRRFAELLYEEPGCGSGRWR